MAHIWRGNVQIRLDWTKGELIPSCLGKKLNQVSEGCPKGGHLYSSRGEIFKFE